MSSFLTEIRETLLPRLDSKDGPLPPLLIGLTFVTGLVDAFSYLVLGHVFVANMTGNVVFLAFALAGVKGFSVTYSILAIAAFVLGSFGAGRLHSRLAIHRGKLFVTALLVQLSLVGVAVILIAISPKNPVPMDFGYGLIASLAFCMGIQNATVRRLVPDLTTTVLTLTMTGIAADSHLAGGAGSKAGRRLLSILSMFFGALIGALMILYASIVYPLAIAFVIKVIITLTARFYSKGTSVWVSPK
jgi:uncharacterized membrane protein YoaK (UPF0700 family)